LSDRENKNAKQRILRPDIEFSDPHLIHTKTFKTEIKQYNRGVFH